MVLHGIQINHMERSLNFAHLRKGEMISSPEEYTQLPFQRVLTGCIHPSCPQVMKLKISKHLATQNIFSDVAIKRPLLASANVVADMSILFYHERKFIELALTHPHDTSTSLFYMCKCFLFFSSRYLVVISHTFT